MGCYGNSRIWYLKRFDAYCTAHDRAAFDRDTVEGWVSEQLARSGRYRSWMSYIRDVGRWLQAHGHADAYVLSDRWKAQVVPAHPYLLSSDEIEAFFAAAATPGRALPVAVASGRVLHADALLRAADRGNPAAATRARAPARPEPRRRVRQGQPLPPAAADRRGHRDPGRLRPGIGAHGSARRGARSSSPRPATRSPPRPSGRSSTASGTRPVSRGRRAVSGRGPTTSATTSPTPTSNGGWRKASDVTAMLPYLARYMGHASIESTYYYIHTSPEFLHAYADITAASQSLLPEVGFE